MSPRTCGIVDNMVHNAIAAGVSPGNGHSTPIRYHGTQMNESPQRRSDEIKFFSGVHDGYSFETDTSQEYTD